MARPRAEFRVLVQKALDDNPDGWVADGNYGNALQGLAVRQAETVVYVIMPWMLMYWRIFWRSVARARDKQIICGDNVEDWRQTFFSRDSLLWFLVKNRSMITKGRPTLLREWARDDALFVELDGRAVLSEFYFERGLVWAWRDACGRCLRRLRLAFPTDPDFHQDDSGCGGVVG